jgi:hypothetical protein
LECPSCFSPSFFLCFFATAHADRTALALIQFILDDPEERATEASCSRAYKQYESEREELLRVTAKLVKTKNQRNAMIDPLKRMTAELKKIEQERRFAPEDKSVVGENDETALLKYLQSQQALDSLVAEAKMWEEEQKVLHLKIIEMGKEFAAKEEALCQILQMKEDELSAKDIWIDQQAFEMDELKQRLNDMETQSVEGRNELSKIQALERLRATKEEELQKQLRAYEAESEARESRFRAFERELEESLAQAHEVVEELELELGTCHNQLQESEEQICLLEQERQERRIQAQPVVVTGEISDSPFKPRQEALGPLLFKTEEKLKGSEEVAAALRRELDEANSALEEKDEKLKILEKYMLEEALGAEKKKEDERSRALEYATGMSAELTDSQMKVKELTEKLAEMTQVIQVIEGMAAAPKSTKQQALPEETMVDEEKETDESIESPMSRRQQASQYFNGILKRDDLAQQLARGFQHVMQTSSSALSVGSRHGSRNGSRHGGSVHAKSSEDGKQLVVPNVLSLSSASSDGESVHSSVYSDDESVHGTAEESKPAEQLGKITRLKQKMRNLEEKNKALSSSLSDIGTGLEENADDERISL